jgi:S-adenosylmethionine:tRNA ribosyltransferase-isomerase
MRLSEFDYDLPASLIAQKPAENRDDSRLMLVARGRSEGAGASAGVGAETPVAGTLARAGTPGAAETPMAEAAVAGAEAEAAETPGVGAETVATGMGTRTPVEAGVTHHVFRELDQLLLPGDLLVFNQTKVIPARLMGEKEGAGGAAVETLLLRDLGSDRWECLVRPGRRLPPGTRVLYGCGAGRIRLEGQVLERTPQGGRIIQFEFAGANNFTEVLDALGEMPLPPYITEKLDRPDRYQTVYARTPGSVAAPTAGLHFTPALLDRLRNRGVEMAEVLLHVGLGTFRPVSAERVEEHVMHREYYEVTEAAASQVNRARKERRRVIAVGTTSVRTLEACAAEGRVQAGSGWTDIFIYPGYRFQIVDGLITNFHLPKSTLLMLVCALAGKERMLSAYQEAIDRGYRFFSFGDAMLILNQM